MILYHGSYMPVEKPDITFSRDNLDFGKGFYATPIKEQAVNWARRFQLKKGSSVVSTYDVDEAALRKYASVLEFKTYSDAWLNFIVTCRHGETKDLHDVVIGGVANDKVFDTIQLFFDQLIDQSEAIRRLRYEKPNIQYCFRSQATIDRYLKFIASEVPQR